VNVSATTTFSLSAANLAGTSRATVTVTVGQSTGGGGGTSPRASGCSTGGPISSFPFVAVLGAPWFLAGRRGRRRSPIPGAWASWTGHASGPKE
jgi:hypothetical protein